MRIAPEQKKIFVNGPASIHDCYKVDCSYFVMGYAYYPCNRVGEKHLLSVHLQNPWFPFWLGVLQSRVIASTYNPTVCWYNSVVRVSVFQTEYESSILSTSFILMKVSGKCMTETSPCTSCRSKNTSIIYVTRDCPYCHGDPKGCMFCKDEETKGKVRVKTLHCNDCGAEF